MTDRQICGALIPGMMIGGEPVTCKRPKGHEKQTVTVVRSKLSNGQIVRTEALEFDVEHRPHP